MKGESIVALLLGSGAIFIGSKPSRSGGMNISPSAVENHQKHLATKILEARDYVGVYNRLTGQHGGFKRSLFKLNDTYDRKSFNRFWKDTASVIPGFNSESNWVGLLSSNEALSTGYNYKMYISVVLDGSQSSAKEFVNFIARFYRDFVKPNINEEVYIAMKYPGKSFMVMDHFDSIVIHSNNKNTIEKIYNKFKRSVSDLNSRYRHIRILSEQERFTYFLRNTMGVDTPTDSDTTGISKMIVMKNPTHREQVIAILRNWMSTPLEKKMSVFRLLEAK